jgi:transcriptional regulator with PAS, ATPase and Fis domain
LLTGETGTGKERVARLLHARSRRAAGPFVAIHCGALPEDLLETELFGHLRGAFTGATQDRRGLFEAAAGGTLLLDELGETSPGMQVKLLRALQEKTVRPVGSNVDRSVDVRVVAATNRDLEAMVGQGSFREDLYYRLRVVPLEVPPLRERRADILPLAMEFIGRTCQEHACGPCSLTTEVLDQLLEYSWPGNVRELENAIERAVLLAEGQPRIDLQDLPPEIRRHAAPLHGEEEVVALAEVERRHIVATLERFGGHRRQTAQALGIGVNTLWRKLKLYGLVRSVQ